MEKKQVLVGEGLFHLPTSPGDEPYLIGSKCRSCGYIAFPRREVCPACISLDSMEEVPLSRRGRIYSWTVARVAPPGFPSPYFQSFIDLEGGPRIFSLISGVDPSTESLEDGMEVELVLEKISEDEQGREVIGYKFRPLRKGGRP